MAEKPKRVYNQWTQEDMQHAIAAFRNNECGFNECCKRYNIPKPTFRRHCRSLNKKANEDTKHHGRLTVFSEEVEQELAQHILKLEERLFGLTIRDVRRLAYQLAEKNGIPNNFNKEKGMAGKWWYYQFMKRHPTLSLRQPEKVSIARANGFNKKNVGEFFDILEKTVDEHGFNAMQIYNVDESGFSTVQKKNQKIVGRKGKHQVGGLSSGERGVNTTIVCCTNAAGSCVPPMIIYKRRRLPNELTVGAPAGAIITLSDTGYINSELFVKWLKHFIAIVQPTIEKKVLLLLDGHTTHSKNYDALVLARQNGIVMLQLPGHTTHRLQPLDVSFFKPMETYFTQAVEKWLRSNPGNAVSQYHMTPLLNEAYSRAASIATIVNGYRATGIWPVDRTVFNDSDFAASEALGDDFVEDGNHTESNEEDPGPEADGTNHGAITNLVPERHATPEPVSPDLNENTLNVSVEEICPIPTVSGKGKKRKQAQSAVILSSSPYKNQLEASQKNKRPIKPKGKQSKTEKKPATPNVEIEVNIEDWHCFICQEDFVEDMLQCHTCKLWAHEGCTDAPSGIKKYICDNCR